ncbi:MAG TPA: hypothetical protein V6C86_17835 [Oculatellaceae cyanobacterium]
MFSHYEPPPTLEQLILQASVLLQADANRPTLIESAKKILKSSGESGINWKQAESRLLSQLRDLGLYNWVAIVEERIGVADDFPSEPRLLMVDAVFVYAASHEFTENITRSAFAKVDEILHHFYFAWDLFVAEAIAQIRSVPTAAQSIIDEIALKISALETDQPNPIALIAKRERERVLNFSDDLLRAWDFDYHYFPNFVNSYAFLILARVDPRSCLSLIETMPGSFLSKFMIDYIDRSVDWDTVTQLLEVSPPSFDQYGTWLAGTNKTTLFLLSRVQNRLCNLLGQDQVGPWKNLFDARLGSLFSLFKSRADSQMLQMSWLQHLVRSELYPVRQNSSSSSAIAEIASTVAANLGPLDEPLPWIEAEDAHRTGERLVCVLSELVSNNTVNRSTVSTLMSAALKKSLLSPLNVLHTARGAFVRSVITKAMTNTNTGWFSEAWNDLFWLRDRLRLLRHCNDLTERNEPLCLVSWNLLALDAAPPLSNSALRSKWVETELAVREGILMSGLRNIPDSWTDCLMMLAAHWSRVFPDDPPTGQEGSLDDFMNYYSYPNMNFVLMSVFLLSHGVQIKRIELTIPNISDILRRVSTDIEFESVRKRVRLPGQKALKYYLDNLVAQGKITL